MTNRREPLANVPNAVNSPFRTVGAANGKRTRAQAGDNRDAVHGQPPSKKQIIEIPDDNVENVDPKKRDGVPAAPREEPLLKRAYNTQPTALERKFASVRDKKTTPQQRAAQPPKTDGDNLETVRQWKRHYKRQFPQFEFYFESVSEEVRLKTSRQLQSLGAREEKFFSKAVTHVITTRAIPSELTSTSPDDDARFDAAPPKTIQPSALSQDQRRTTSLLDANLQRRAQTQAVHVSHDVEPRKAQGANADILSRARELGIKIWALEKLQRILRTILETDTGDQTMAPDMRNHVAVNKAVAKPTKDVDLEQLLRNEKITGPADRDMTVAAQDMVSFKGCYIYIHDMDEKTKPVMVRDYPKPVTKEQGKWPQFRLTPAGRCPFVEDPGHTRKLQQQEREAQAAAKVEQDMAVQRKTRAGSASLAPPRALAEREVNLRRSPRKMAQQPTAELAKPLDPPKALPTKRQPSADGMPPLFGSAQQSLRGLPRMIGGEPVASGLQQSNITSAIRSQVISSAAISSTAVGVNNRVCDSKEVSALKRKVLERGASVNSNYSMPSSYMNDVRAALNDDNNPPPRAAKRKAQETLGVLHEGDEDSQDGPRPTHRRPPAPKKRKSVQKEPKPGYCENCRDKFDDFDDHCNSRKHRKFALTQENWSELDALLVQLKRPHKVANHRQA
ncbi:Cdc7p-Dbf4p kinase complex regulatory subunit [Vermiconidia calcicola]|uniref:Cdc7p-Dbf4p kinase complex regulatory subunit n=1 Tax=Vermiconidia calcicola TaxID=1690605 RepID=A0ACC3M8Q6_9PEZI|nr:Cdc7p-Dbf4p kinase complex regulatory subunit [Vermiconidia calcicola]